MLGTLRATVLSITEHSPGYYTAEVRMNGEFNEGFVYYTFEDCKSTLAFGGGNRPKRTLTYPERKALNKLTGSLIDLEEASE